MLKLYKRIDNQLHYWETWDTDHKSAIIHWGIVGTKGQKREVKSGLFSSLTKKVRNEIAIKLKEGYEELYDDNKDYLDICYKVVDNSANEEELSKQNRLRAYLNELLHKTGISLGTEAGHGYGEGFIFLCFPVVDFDIAKKVIEEELKNTEFSDYSEISRYFEAD